jgi:hypothetical protein
VYSLSWTSPFRVPSFLFGLAEASLTQRDHISAIWVVGPERPRLLLPPRLDHRAHRVDAVLLDDDAADGEPDSEEYTCTPKMGSSSMTDVGVADAKTNWAACCCPLGAVGGQQATTLRIPEEDDDDDDVVVEDASWLLVLLVPLNGESLDALLCRAVPGASPVADPDALEQLDVTVRIGGGRRLVKGDCAAKLGVRMSIGASPNACLGGADEGAGLKYGRHGDPCPCCPLSRSSSLTAKTWSAGGGGGDGGDGDGPTDAPAPPRDSHDRAALDPPLGLP